MQTALDAFIKDTPAGTAADAILRKCVHCGLCLPACPTYQILGDELDSPRGRIYLMKQLLEGQPVSACTQLHLDRCLGCRACESACPSGVQYGLLLDLGRVLTEERVKRPRAEAVKRRLLATIVPHSARARTLLRAARWLRPILPGALGSQIPTLPRRTPPGSAAWPVPRHARRVVILPGCVQPALAGGVDPAAARVLDHLGISAVAAAGSGCCGAVTQHLCKETDTLEQVRHNGDVLWPHLQAGAEAVVFTASACTAMLGDDGRLLRKDPRYADRARISGLGLARDISQVVAAESAALGRALRRPAHAQPAGVARRVAFQAPCSLQHALKLAGVVEPLLLAAGFTLTAVTDGQRCCGSAGTYSILQPEPSQLLRAKVSALASGDPEVIATANVGCLHHIRSGTPIPVRHWIELLAERLADG